MFSDRLRKLREEKGITQFDMAKAINISRTSLSSYELGVRTPDIDVLERIANFFNVSSDYLLGRENEIIHIDSQAAEIDITKACQIVDTSGLPEEAIKQIEDYIELLKMRYQPGRTTRKK